MKEKKAIDTHNGIKETIFEKEATEANMAIQNQFYGEKHLEDDIDTSLSMNSNIGAVLLPEEHEEE
ncbi:hypothetical protein JOC75_002716 [Metabacillus crassostreae]|uniref:hypothetical protein n=1 Tax=Metabacillus crassostreae TaxID=929098 RepID=UPI001958A717|nr:hypothetical protein [Metabacillus crassostreae]MBM7604713.1 hypothetical protein [Metabacillus crassostreae]